MTAIELLQTVARDRADPVLAEHAREIRRLGKRAKADLIEMGRRLADAKIRAGHGYWLTWLDEEFGWSAKTAERLISLYEFSRAEIFDFDKMSNLELPVSALYLLAASSTPAEIQTDIVERARSGEILKFKAVARAIKCARAGDRDRDCDQAEADVPADLQRDFYQAMHELHRANAPEIPDHERQHRIAKATEKLDRLARGFWRERADPREFQLVRCARGRRCEAM